MFAAFFENVLYDIVAVFLFGELDTLVEDALDDLVEHAGLGDTLDLADVDDLLNQETPVLVGTQRLDLRLQFHQDSVEVFLLV